MGARCAERVGVRVFPFSATAFGARLGWFGAAAKALVCGEADTVTVGGGLAKCLKPLGAVAPAPAPDESRTTLPGVGVGDVLAVWL